MTALFVPRLRSAGIALLLAPLVMVVPALVPAERTAPTVLAPLRAEAATPKPYKVGGRWALKFWDGFTGTRLKTSNWRPNWLGPDDRAVTKPINSLELSCYHPRNVTVARSTLRLKAERRSCRANNGRTYRYTSGMVESRHDFRFSYGYAEARIYLPPSNGSKAPRGSCGPNWGAFWLNGDNWRTDGEIDIMECLSGDDVAWHYHWGTGRSYSNGGYPRAFQNTMPGGGWHRFGVDWAPGRATFYYDGVKVGTQTRGITGRPHYLILNLGVSGSRIAVPQTMYVDYVRVWQRR